MREGGCIYGDGRAERQQAPCTRLREPGDLTCTVLCWRRLAPTAGTQGWPQVVDGTTTFLETKCAGSTDCSSAGLCGQAVQSTGTSRLDRLQVAVLPSRGIGVLHESRGMSRWACS